jgi:hypothetical protein
MADSQRMQAVELLYTAYFTEKYATREGFLLGLVAG